MIAEYETNVMALVQTNYLAHSKPNQQNAILPESKTTVQSINQQLYDASVYIRQLKGDEQKFTNALTVCLQARFRFFLASL
jgi:hypothetical protein